MKPSSFPPISEFIHTIRGHKVILDSDLAKLYGVTTGNLNKSVSRHLDRFPDDFMFQLNLKEVEILRFQIGISSHGGRRYLPRVFTQEGIAMLSSVLSSPRAIQVNPISCIRSLSDRMGSRAFTSRDPSTPPDVRSSASGG